MASSLTNYWFNLFNLLRGQRPSRPLVVTYYVTTQCNLNCAYCEDFGARRNASLAPPLPLEQVMRILQVIRSGTDRLILTGGEPLLHPHIEAIVEGARRKLGFRGLTLLTNAALLHQHENILPYLDRLVISLDTLDSARWSKVLNTSTQTTERIFENIHTYAAFQHRDNFRLVVNCVVSAQTLSGALDVLDFCEKNHLMVSFSPQAVQNWPAYDLLVSPDYKAFLAELIARKQRGAPVLGSLAYLRTLANFNPYACYPLLAPRVLPGGELIYPCRPIERVENGHGGHPCSLLETQTWTEATQKAVESLGQPPLMCASCYQQCFAEPSLMQGRPLQWLGEWLNFPSSRAADLPTFAPG
jgi:MoaA/NifB/PqqE/SkfB family radical SAM enzyme